MLASMTGQQLAEWIVYAEKEPFGEERADLRMAIVAALMANLWRGKDDPVREPEEFMPRFEPHPQPPQKFEEHEFGEGSEEEDEEAEMQRKMEIAMKVDAYFSALSAANSTPNPSPNERTPFGEGR